MWKNYIKTAFRNLWKFKFYSFINIFGLALGMACFLFILLFVKEELSYDRYHQRAERTYRMDFYGKIFEQEIDIPQVGDPWGPLLLSEFPEVEQQLRLREQGHFLVRNGETSFREEEVIFADSTLFDVFSFELLEGDPSKALTEPYTIVIDTDIAKKYFGAEDPMGQALIFDNDRPYRITGVMTPVPVNTHFRKQIFASMATLDESRSGQWMNFNFNTYLVLREGATPKSLEAQFPKIAKTYIGSQLQQFMGVGYDEFLAGGNDMQFSLMPVTDIHLNSHKSGELAPPGDIKYVYISSFIGLFILFLACINFMNLSTARSANRAREVGMRKVVGARRRQLIEQFLSESVLMSGLSLLVGLGLVVLFLPAFNRLSGKAIELTALVEPWLLAALAGLTLLVGLVAGSYPALYLSGFRPIRVLKGKWSGGVQTAWLRNGLVVFQFMITVGLIVGTLVIFDQLKYIQNKKLGFEKEQVLVLNDAYALGNNAEAFKQEIRQHPMVVNASLTSYLPTPSSRNNNAHFLGRNPKPEDTHVIQSWYVDHDFIQTLGMEMVEGRAFSRSHPADSLAVIINEQAAKIFGLTDPLGQEIGTYSGGDDDPAGTEAYKVIGVVKDFHFESLRQRIGPLIMHLGNSRSFLVLRIKGNDINRLVADLQRRWNEMAPGQPFDYNFLDDRFAAMYESETRVARIIGVFTLLAILIACLGLFGLATYTAEQRTKEIGIRKVLGAPVSRIFILLSSQFTRLVLLANLIALPLAYYTMGRWLEGFEYQAGIHWSILLAAAVIVVGIALLTVSYQAIRAARRNPVQALKYE